MFLNKKKNIRTEDIYEIKQNIHELYTILNNRSDKSADVLDIMDVLSQVYKNIDTQKHPEVLINKLVNYIRNAALRGKLYFPKNEEQLIDKLSLTGQQAGWNSINRGDYSDKSQFYSWKETIPRH